MLAKKHRLGKTSEVQRVFGKGRAFFNSLFTIKYLASSVGLRFTVVVSTKVSKKAVVRNRLKRIIRELIRLNTAKFRTGDYVVIFKPVAAKKESAELLAKFSELCRTSKLAQI